jgi:hypothetical protein
MANNECYLVNHLLRVLILVAKYMPETWSVNPHAMAVMQAVAARDWNGRWREFDNNNGPEDWVIEYEGTASYDGYYIFGTKHVVADIEEFVAEKDKQAGNKPGYWDGGCDEPAKTPTKPKYAGLDVKCATLEDQTRLICAVLGEDGRSWSGGSALGADGAEYAYALDSHPSGFGVSGIWLGPPETVPIPWRSAT